MGLCGADDKAARELAAKSLRTFFGPDRPYLKDQTHLYEQLVEPGAACPSICKANFARYLKTDGTEGAPDGGSLRRLRQIATALWNQIDADTLVERGVLVAGDPESCLEAIAIHEAAGVDELQFLMATETVPHDKVMTSIEMFGKHVIPKLRKSAGSRKLNAGSSGGSGAPKKSRRWSRGKQRRRRDQGQRRCTATARAGCGS